MGGQHLGLQGIVGYLDVGLAVAAGADGVATLAPGIQSGVDGEHVIDDGGEALLPGLVSREDWELAEIGRGDVQVIRAAREPVVE